MNKNLIKITPFILPAAAILIVLNTAKAQTIVPVFNLNPGVNRVICSEGPMRLRWLNETRSALRITCPESKQSPTTTPSPTTVTRTPQATNQPTPQPTTTSHPTHTPTPTQVSGTHNGAGFGKGTGNYGREVGINLDRLNQLRAEIAQGKYARECTPAEHDPTKWHSLVNVEANCHYDHHHGDDPSYVDDLFGQTGAWFGKPGQSISYPWQTFRATTMLEPNNVAMARREMENDLKHEGYVWIVRRNQPCVSDDGNNRGNCITDFRLQTHAMMGAGDFPIRYHSFSIEERVCLDAANPATCGIIRRGGWADTGRLFTTPVTDRVPGNCGNNRTDIHVPVPADTLFIPLETEAERPWDEIRCHPQFNRTTQPAPNGRSNELARWWVKPTGASELRFQVFFNDPVSELNPNDPGQWRLLCNPNQPKCDYTASILSAELAYIHFIRGSIHWTSGVDGNNPRVRDFYLDPDRNNIIDNVTLWTDRWGDPRQPGACTAASLDCIPNIYNGVRLNGIFSEGQAGYVQVGHCRTCEKVDHDISPPNQQWVTWFYRHAGHTGR